MDFGSDTAAHPATLVVGLNQQDPAAAREFGQYFALRPFGLQTDDIQQVFRPSDRPGQLWGNELYAPLLAEKCIRLKKSIATGFWRVSAVCRPTAATRSEGVLVFWAQSLPPIIWLVGDYDPGNRFGGTVFGELKAG